MYTDWPPLLIATALTITSTSTEAPTTATAMVTRPTLLPVVERTKPIVTWLHAPVHGRSFQVVLLLGGLFADFLWLSFDEQPEGGYMTFQ